MGILHILGGIIILSVVTVGFLGFLAFQIKDAKMTWACFREDAQNKMKKKHTTSVPARQYRRVSGL